MLLLVVFTLWLVLVFWYRYVVYPVSITYKNRHVVIVGGSEGIGKEVAAQFLSKGAQVTLVSRSTVKLEKAVSDLCRLSKEYVCKFHPIDITDETAVCKGFTWISENFGGIDTLVLAAGKAYPGQDVEIFKKTIDLNYFGAVRCVKTILPMFLREIAIGSNNSNRDKQICFIGSACSVVSFLGYGSYAPSKFALKGFADAVRNEFQGSGISVSFAFPPDTNTPGFVEENKIKPKETLDMFPPAVYSAELVARYLVDGLSRKEYILLSPDLGQNLMVANMSSLTPKNRWTPLLVPLAPLIQLLMLVISWHCDGITKTYGKKILSEIAET